tara:strand:- start:1642 stop:6312 length:4671 start_codon:yes stop_codon:yes gene_type:complete
MLENLLKLFIVKKKLFSKNYIVFFIVFLAYASTTYGQDLIHNFEFNGNLNDTKIASVALATENLTSSSFGTNPNSFTWSQSSNPGGGLVFLTDQLSDATSYSVGIRISYNETGPGYKKIISFNGATADNGLYYQNKNLEFFPFGKNDAITYEANTFYDFVLTRTTSGNIKVYIVQTNGTVTLVYDKQDTSNASVPRLVGGKHEFRFFMDDTHTNSEHSTGGTVRAIRLWNAPLSQSQIGAALSSVTTGDAQNVSGASATITGEVNPQGSTSSFEFEYGTTTSYGTTIIASPSSSAATIAVPVTANISGLQTGLTYHYRLKSTNTAGVAFGSDKTFTTLAAGGVPGANLWLKANEGVTNSGNNITGWTDFTGQNTFTVNGTPGYTTNAINFNPIVSFDNTEAPQNDPSSYLDGNTSINFVEGMAVFKKTNNASGSLIGSTSIGTNYGKTIFSGDSANDSYVGNGANGTFHKITNPILANTFSLTNWDISNTASPFAEARVNGLSQTVTQGAANIDFTLSLTPRIGGTHNGAGGALGWKHFRGEVAEMILYPSSLSSIDKVKIQSYLGLKYGITLDASVANYVNSSGTSIWSNTTYWNDVFGIGMDNTGGLNQPKSNSVNSGSGDGTGQSGKANIVLSNSSSLDDGDFLLLGNNGAALSEQTTGLPTSEIHRTRITREWKVKHTGNVGTVNMTFDLKGICLSGIFNTNYTLLIDEDGNGDFTNGTITKVVASALASEILSFNGITLNDGAVFTIMGEPSRIDLTSAVTTLSQTTCLNTAIVDIVYTGTNLSGATVTGLPAGVTSNYNNGVITISGTPSTTGLFNYTVTTTSSECSSAPQTIGHFTVDENDTVSIASSTPTVQRNLPLNPITHTTTGATGIGTATGLPTGVTATWSGDMITISGTPNVLGTFNYTIPVTGGCGNINATGTITVSDVLDTDNDGIIDTVDLDDDNDGILDTEEGFASITPANPISSYSETTRTEPAGSGVSITTPTNGYIVTDNSSTGVFAFSAVSRSETGSGGGVGTKSFVTIDVDFAPKEYVNNVQVSFKIGSQTSATGQGYFDEGFYIEINGVVVVNFNYLAYNGNAAFNAIFDVNGGNWAPWNGEGNPELVLDLQNRTVKLLADTKSGTRQDALPFMTNATPNAMPAVDFESGVTIGTAFNNESGPGGIGYQTLTFSADVKTHRDSDGNGIFDYLELDSDKDGCTDVDEAYGAGTDTNGNGQYGATPTVANGQINANGLVIAAGINNGGNAYSNPPADRDSNGVADYEQLSKTPDAITLEPTDVTSTIDNPAVFTTDFSTTGTGTEPSIQWYTKKVGTTTEVLLINSTTVSGSDTKTLTISDFKSTNNGDVFYAKVTAPTNVCIPEIITREALLNVTPHSLIANDDSFTIIKTNSVALSSFGVHENDLIQGNTPILITEVTLAATGVSSQVGFLSNNGLIVVNSNLPAGVYTLQYIICEVADPTNCQTATVTVTVLEDTDLDGVADINDLDDDNDGILDTEEGTCTLPAQMRLGYVPNSRDLDSDNGYTFDGSHMTGLRSKIENPAKFWPIWNCEN